MTGDSQLDAQAATLQWLRLLAKLRTEAGGTYCSACVTFVNARAFSGKDPVGIRPIRAAASRLKLVS